MFIHREKYSGDMLLFDPLDIVKCNWIVLFFFN